MLEIKIHKNNKNFKKKQKMISNKLLKIQIIYKNQNNSNKINKMKKKIIKKKNKYKM